MSQGKKTQAPLRRGIIKDKVSASDYLSLTYTHACEDCSHFIADSKSCSLGHPTHPHLYKNQMRSFAISGTMAICRNHEID